MNPTFIFKKNIDFLIIILLAFLVYHQHYNYGFNFGDEGSLAYITEAMLEGKVPFIDISIGYNIMWYYPSVLLFYLFGSDFIFLKIFLFSIAAFNSILSYHIIFSFTKNRILSFLTSLIFILVPGPIHKIYIPLMSLCAIIAFKNIKSTKKSIAGITPSAILVGISSLFRVEMGIMFFCIFLITILIRTIFTHQAFKYKIRLFFYSLVTSFNVILVTLLPFFILSYLQNFHQNFLNQYKNWIFYLFNSFIKLISSISSNQDNIPNIKIIKNENTTTLQRAPLNNLFNKESDSQFILLTHTPLFLLGLIITIVIIIYIKKYISFKKSNLSSIDTPTNFITICFITICSYFQFYFFRSDLSHLIQAMPPLIILLIYLSSTLLKISKTTHKSKSIIFILPITLISIYLYIYTTYSISHGLGFRPVNYHNFLYLSSKNGVNLYLPPFLYKELSPIKDIILSNSSKNDFIVCYPYMPGINFMTDRKTFKSSLYVDNSAVATNPNWNQSEIQSLSSKKVKVVVVWHDYAINGTEFSKFKNWAKPLYEHLKANYKIKKDNGMMQVFVKNFE